MNSRDEARHSSLLETKLFCSNNSTIGNTDPSFSDDVDTLNGMLADIDEHKIKHQQILVGYTIDKLNKEELVIKDLLFIMPRIQTWASRPAVNRPDMKAAATIAESELPKMVDTVLLTKAKEMKQILIDNPTIIPDFVTAARQTSFNTNIDNYEAVIEMPEEKIDERATETRLMTEGIKTAIDFRKDTLLTSAKVFRETEPEFFLNFKQTMKIDNNPSATLSLKGSAKEGTGEGIANVTVLIAELGVSAKTGKKGNFLFKTLPAGQYTVMFSKFGYVTEQRTVFINDSERTALDVVMRRVVV